MNQQEIDQGGLPTEYSLERNKFGDYKYDDKFDKHFKKYIVELEGVKITIKSQKMALAIKLYQEGFSISKASALSGVYYTALKDELIKYDICRVPQYGVVRAFDFSNIK